MLTLKRCGVWAALLSLVLGSVRSVRADDLLDLYLLALQRDPALQAVRYAHRSSHETVTQAYARLLPAVSFSAGYDLTRQHILGSDTPMYQEGKSRFGGYNLTLTLTQPLFRYAAMAQVRQAHAVVEQAEYELVRAEQELVRRVAELYLAALAAEEEVRFSQAEHAALQLHYELARVQQRRGLAAMTDLFDARARLDAAEARQIVVKHARDDALQGLSEVCGVRVERVAEIRQEFPLIRPDPADEEEWVEAALVQNLALQVQRRAVELAAREVMRLRAGHLPTLDLVLRGNRQRSGGTLFGEGYETEVLNARVELNVPLFQGGYVRSQVQEASLLHQRSLAEKERVRRAVERATRAAYWGVVGAIGRVEALRQSVASAQVALDARQKGFDSGMAASPDVLDGIRDVFMARRDFAQARYDYIVNSLRLKETVGTLSGADIAAVNQWLEE